MYLDSSGKTSSGIILSSAPLSILYAGNQFSHFLSWIFLKFFRVGFLSVSCSFWIFSTRQRFLWLSTTNCLKCWDKKTCTVDGHDYQQPDMANQMMVIVTWDDTHRTRQVLCRTICSSMYIHRLHIHTPRPAEREWNEGSLGDDGKHGTCGPPERRPVERERS